MEAYEAILSSGLLYMRMIYPYEAILSSGLVYMIVEKWKSQPFSRFCISKKMILCTHSELGKCCSQVNMANQKCNVAWRRNSG